MTLTPERAAAVANTEREIAERFDVYGIPEPTEKAAGIIRWLQSKGWRVHPELAAGAPPTPRKADPDVQAAAVAAGKAAVEAKRRARQEAENPDHVDGQLELGAHA